jgi:hypothetical protein
MPGRARGSALAAAMAVVALAGCGKSDRHSGPSKAERRECAQQLARLTAGKPNVHAGCIFKPPYGRKPTRAQERALAKKISEIPRHICVYRYGANGPCVPRKP